jgi:hypothetical protein
VRSVSSVVKYVTIAVVAAALCEPMTLAAQNKFSFTPWIGSYYPFGKYFDKDISLDSIGIGTGLRRITVSQENTAMFGARATIPIGPTVAVEGSFAYASSNVRFILKNPSGVSGAFDFASTQKGNVVVGSVRVVYKPRRSNLSLLAGGIIVNHGGKFWSDSLLDGKKTNFGGVVGIGLRANVTPRFPIDIRAELNVYSFNPDKRDNTLLGFYPKTTHEDLVFSLGVPIGSR